MVDLETLVDYCQQLLQPGAFADYCPNGLQVDVGKSEIRRLVSGVTACQSLIERAVELEADLLLVHHGFFWRGEPAPLTGIKGRRVRTLIQGGIGLLAYHLPLDCHAEFGNNRGLGDALGLAGAPVAGSDGLLWSADLTVALTPSELAKRLQSALGRAPLHLPGQGESIRRVGWCTGAAQGEILAAAEAGLDAFISGEVSEQSCHLASELGVHYFAAGHHATERFGVRTLGDHLAARFALDHRFVDIANPA